MIELTPEEQARRAALVAKRKKAYPAAGPVKVTKIDGSVEVLPPVEGGDESKPGRWTGRGLNKRP